MPLALVFVNVPAARRNGPGFRAEGNGPRGYHVSGRLGTGGSGRRTTLVSHLRSISNGRLYEKLAKTKAHGYVGAAINRAVNRRLPDGWSLWPESTVVLDATNAPLPDFALVGAANPLEFAAPDRCPGPGDIGLLIEVAVTSLHDDTTTALEQYARALIPVYWVVDVLGRRILVHTEPRVVDGRGEYADVETYRPGQSLPLLLDGQVVARIPFDELRR